MEYVNGQIIHELPLMAEELILLIGVHQMDMITEV